MKFVNVTVKIPEQLHKILIYEAGRSGTTVKRLSGEILAHGFTVLKAEAEARAKAKQEEQNNG